jgi:AmmeMemoRadiSam system protein A
MDFELKPEERLILLRLARETIASQFKLTNISTFVPSPQLTRPCGAFVTLHKKTGALRGCIGYITASRPLTDTIKEAALACAFHDSRFTPLQEKELEHVHIEISVLSPFQKIKDLEEIQVGHHGLLIRSGYKSGLLLPQVAIEQGWNKETFLRNTCLKAGLPGECWKNPYAEIEIFRALVFNEQQLLS